VARPGHKNFKQKQTKKTRQIKKQSVALVQHEYFKAHKELLYNLIITQIKFTALMTWRHPQA
jgi:hypothetical protein